MLNRWSGFLLVLPLVLCLTTQSEARQREYAIGLGVDLISGGSRIPGRFSQTVQNGSELPFFYGVYPSLNMTGRGASSALHLSYGYGLDQIDVTPKFRSASHTVSADVSEALGATWQIRVRDSFETTSDSTTYNAFRGVATDPDGFAFLFEPVDAGITTRSNRLDLTAQHDLSSRSTLSFTGTHSFRLYGGEAGFVNGLSDQQRISTGLTFRRQSSVRRSWSLGYTLAYSAFDEYEDAGTVAGHLGTRIELARDVTFEIVAGPSFVSGRGFGKDYWGYNGSASIRKRLQYNTFTLYYAEESGNPSGLGAISDTRRAGVSLNRSGRGVNAFLDVSVFDARGRLGNPYRTRGISSSATLGYGLTDTVSMHVGVRYYRYTETTDYGFTQERAFVTFRYADPDLWTFLH